jgi:pimeloyl-ACP methyl ester carboxylesterase
MSVWFGANLERSPLLLATAAAFVFLTVCTTTLAAQGGNDFFVGKPPHQMYVQHLPPAAGTPKRPYPLVLVHGGSHTGVVWLTTPDGRPGWAPYFAERGWPVYVVDWPGVGRSGFAPDFVTMGPTPIVNALIALLDRVGPSAILGWSLGGAITFKVADRVPEKVRAVIGVAATAPSNTTIVRPTRAATAPIFPDYDARQERTRADRYPRGALEQHLSSMVPLSPSIVNASRAAGPEFRIDNPEAVRKLPILYIVGEQDTTVTSDRSEPAAKFYGVPLTRLGADWGLPGHGHPMMIEEDNLAIAERIAKWLESRPSATP